MAAHVSTATPVNAALFDATEASARSLGITLLRALTCACVEGPRLGTWAESHLLRHAGCQLAGMTNVPEVLLARDAQLAYAMHARREPSSFFSSISARPVWRNQR